MASPKEAFPRIARRYFDFRDELLTDDGLLLKGPCLVILNSLKEEYLHRLHEGHLSATKVKANAMEHLYWPGIDADIEDYSKHCKECIKRARQPKEPLQPHDMPEGPWLKLGMDYFNFNGVSYVLISDYFSKFPYMFKAKTSFWSLKDHLINLFAIEGYPDEIVTDNSPPFSSQEFNRFLFKLGITHTTSSPHYPRSNGSVERMVQMVKTLLSKNSNTRSFQEVLADLRATCISTGLPSPAEILHGRNPATKESCQVDYKAIRSVLQESQLKMKLSHDKSHRAKKARPLVVGERYYAFGPKDKWLECFIVGIRDTGRSYDIKIEATGANLMRNHSHIRPRSPDIPLIHDLYLQPKTVPSGGEPSGTLNLNENSILSEASSTPVREPAALHMDNSKMVLSGPSNISKPLVTSKVLVSDTATRSQPSRGAKQTRLRDNPVSSIKAIPACTDKTKRRSTRNRRSPIAFDVTDPDLLIPLRQAITESIPDQRDAQPSVTHTPSASLSASLQPSSSETTTKEPSVVLPISPSSGSDTQSSSESSSSESSSGTSSSSETSFTTTSPSTGTTSTSSSALTSPEMLEMECSFGTIFNQEHDKLGHAVTRNTIISAKQRILMMQRAIEQQQWPRPVSAPPIASQPLPSYPRRRLSDMGSESKVQAGNATTAHKNSTPETSDRLQDIPEEPRRRIGPSRVKDLAKYFTPTSDEEENSHVNTRTRRKNTP